MDEAPKKTVQELIQDTEKAFSNFIYMVFYANPNKDLVRAILDDGSIKVYMKRPRFLQMIESVGNFNLETYNNFIKIKEAIQSYGKWYLYDRNKQVVVELTESIDYEHIRPQDLLEETRKGMSNPDKDRFNNLAKQYSDQVLSLKDESGFTISNPFKRMFATIRSITRKKKNI